MPADLTKGWGLTRDGMGLLGIGSTGSNSQTTPADVTVSQFTAAITNAVSGLFLRQDGTVWWCGPNDTGVAGTGSTDASNHPNPTQIMALASVVVTKIGIAFGGTTDGNAFALDNAGNLYGWGTNAQGQFGQGNTSTYYSPTIINTGVVDFDAGNGHVLVLKASGVVQSAGANANGQLAIGSTTSQTSWQTVTPSGTALAVQPAAGFSCSLLRMDDGSVRAAGFNSSGAGKQLGGTAGSGNFTSWFTLTEYTNVVDIWTGGDASSSNGSTSIRKNDGTVYGMGLNSNGQLGNGNTTSASTAQLLIVPGGVTIAHGPTRGVLSRAFAFVGSDGHIYTWGLGAFGAMGNGAVSLANSTPFNGTGLTGAAWVGGGGDSIWAGGLLSAVVGTSVWTAVIG